MATKVIAKAMEILDSWVNARARDVKEKMRAEDADDRRNRIDREALSRLKILMGEYRRSEHLKRNDEFFGALRYEAHRQSAIAHAQYLYKDPNYKALLDLCAYQLALARTNHADEKPVQAAFDQLARQRHALPRLVTMEEIKMVRTGVSKKGDEASARRAMRDLGWGAQIPIVVDSQEDVDLHLAPPHPRIGEPLQCPCQWGRRVLVSIPVGMFDGYADGKVWRLFRHAVRVHMRSYRKKREEHTTALDAMMRKLAGQSPSPVDAWVKDTKTCARMTAVAYQMLFPQDLRENRRGSPRNTVRASGSKRDTDARSKQMLHLRVPFIDLAEETLCDPKEQKRDTEYNGKVLSHNKRASDDEDSTFFDESDE